MTGLLMKTLGECCGSAVLTATSDYVAVPSILPINILCQFFLHCYPLGKFHCKNVAPKLHEILYSVVKCNNSIRAKVKTECLFQRFREANHAYHKQWHITRGLSQRLNLSSRGPTNNTQ